MSKLFVGNCSFGLDETTLENFITSHGIEVSSVQIIRDRETGRSRGFGFAELTDPSTIDKAIEALNGQEVDGRALTVNEAREKTQGGGGNRGNHSNRW